MRIHADTDMQTICMYSACIACITMHCMYQTIPKNSLKTLTPIHQYMHIHAYTCNTRQYLLIYLHVLHANTCNTCACICMYCMYFGKEKC